DLDDALLDSLELDVPPILLEEGADVGVDEGLEPGKEVVLCGISPCRRGRVLVRFHGISPRTTHATPAGVPGPELSRKALLGVGLGGDVRAIVPAEVD